MSLLSWVKPTKAGVEERTAAVGGECQIVNKASSKTKTIFLFLTLVAHGDRYYRNCQ
jgi:hypothetical protein